jgi:phosphate transport system substrate-binding protein
VATAGSTSVEQVVLNGLDDTYANLGSTATTYQFWTVEYLYSYGTPSPGSLAASFLTYLTNETAKLLVGSYGYYPCLDKSQKLAPLCSPSAR